MPKPERFSAEKIARLACIELEPRQIKSVQQKLDSVLDFIAVLDELELETVEPFFGTAEADVTRDDQIRESLARDVVLKNAPESDGEYFQVPPVFESSGD